MIYTNCAANRARLVDEPIVETLLTKKYFKSGVKFMHADLSADFSGTDIICSINGVNKSLNVKRNASKYWNSKNFTITFYKDKLNIFNNSTFVFIDELADCLYVVRGDSLLKYILEHSDKVFPSKAGSSFYIIAPKCDIAEMTSNGGTVIKYSKRVAKILENNRDESMFVID